MSNGGRTSSIDVLIGAHCWLRRPECYDFGTHLSHEERNVLLGSIGAEVRRRREKLGLSQGALATKAGVHTNVIGRTERGIYNPTVMTLNAIAVALNVSLVDLLEGTSAQKKRKWVVARLG